MKSFLVKLVFLSLLCALSFAQSSYIPDFYRGDLYEKTQAVEGSSARGDSDLAIISLDFCITTYDYLKDDGQFNTLAETSVRALTPDNCRGKEELVGEKLRDIFSIFADTKVKVAVLDDFALFPSEENLKVVNDFFHESMQTNAAMDEALLKAVLFMGTYGDSSSFYMLFIADILDLWPAYKDILATAYGGLEGASSTEISRFVATASNNQKIAAVTRLKDNPKLPKKIYAEVAENVLSSVIYNNDGAEPEGGGESFSKDDLELILVCLDAISTADWMPASSLALSCFEGLREAYENGELSETGFAEAVNDIASVPAPETSNVLLSYLDSLNKKIENGESASDTVALSVIKAIGGLGDKNSFDTLLYSTYLNYPEEVIAEARVALSKLRW